MLTLTDIAHQRQHLLAQCGVECRKRLVQQQDRLFPDQTARQRHALALSAGELAR